MMAPIPLTCPLQTFLNLTRYLLKLGNASSFVQNTTIGSTYLQIGYF